MGYCTIAQVDNILAQALTSATNPQTTGRRNNLTIGATRSKNNIADTIVEQYIQWAGQEIDSYLSELYKTPLCELADFEGEMFADLTEYNTYIILGHNCPLASGDMVILTDGITEERHTIDEVLGDGIFSTVTAISYPFEQGTRVLRVKFPDPISFVCARLSAANIYDKYFAAQVSPNISDYGKNLRMQSYKDIDDIRNGRTILHGIKRIGYRFFDNTLSDQYNLPKGQESNRNLEIRGN